jgi:hypothetical protein
MMPSAAVRVSGFAKHFRSASAAMVSGPFKKKQLPANRQCPTSRLDSTPNPNAYLERITMTRKGSTELIGEILPDQIYRTTLATTIFGYAPQRARDLEKSGQLPQSFPLSPSSKFRAWTGAQILDHRARMRALAGQQAKAERERPPQPQPLALQRKIKKMKLRPPKKIES